MKKFTKPVTNRMVMRTDLVDGFVLLRAKWEQDEDEKTRMAIVRIEDLDALVETMQKPEDLKFAKIRVPSYGIKDHSGHARAVLLSADADTTRIAYLRNAYVDIRGMDSDVPQEAKVVFADFHLNAFYKADGKLLNSYYANSVTEDSYDLDALIQLAECSDWLHVPGHYGSDTLKIYTVPGNGRTINLEFEVTSDEYEEAVLKNRSWDRVGDLLRAKGVDVESLRADRDKDLSL